MANEAKEMCDWIKRENKLATLSFSKPCGLEVSYLIRNKILGVMTSILQGYIVENTFFYFNFFFVSCGPHEKVSN